MTMDDFSLNITCEPEEKSVKKTKKIKTDTQEKVGIKRKSHDGEPPDKWMNTKKKKASQDSVKIHNSEKTGGDVRDSGIISSLFAKNPEIPTIEDVDVKPIEEPVFSSELFKGLNDLHPHIVANLEQNFGITKMTTVQRLSIQELLLGKDALVRSQTGSGKTLAYAVPIIQSLQKIYPKISRADGVRALIVLPTRELALQTYECFLKLVKSFTWIVSGIMAGGEKRKSEKARIRKGINVLIGTPGRLLDHTEHTKSLSLHMVNWLILDEGDKLLDMGYEKDIKKLVEVIESHREEQAHLMILPKRQTVLLSATLSQGVERLAGLALKDPVHIDASNSEESINNFIVPQSLSQKYIITPAKLRLVTLASFIIRKSQIADGSKMLIFMATQDMVDFHTELLSTVLDKTAEFFKLHGNMTQSDRTQIFKTFRSANVGILLCTDVASRGLDLSKVDWIVQYTAPATPADYVHRVGRTARVGSRGSALLFLSPDEMPFLDLLNNKRIKLNEESMNYYLESLLMVDFISPGASKKGWDMEKAAMELQISFEQAVLQQKKLHEHAANAFKSWVRFYASYPKESREIFSFKKLHLGHYAKSFALRDPPSAISGIGKPKHGSSKSFKKRHTNARKPSGMGRTKRLVISEFDSGL